MSISLLILGRGKYTRLRFIYILAHTYTNIHASLPFRNRAKLNFISFNLPPEVTFEKLSDCFFSLKMTPFQSEIKASSTFRFLFFFWNKSTGRWMLSRICHCLWLTVSKMLYCYDLKCFNKQKRISIKLLLSFKFGVLIFFSLCQDLKISYIFKNLFFKIGPHFMFYSYIEKLVMPNHLLALAGNNLKKEKQR